MAERSRGECLLCGTQAAKGAMLRHLARCASSHEGSERAIQLRVEGGGPYWLDIDVAADARLSDLDAFLREVWLECCGHLSQFLIGDEVYANTDAFGLDLGERTMELPISEALPRSDRFGYEYDFGSTTELELRVIGPTTRAVYEEAVRLLARNEAPQFQCWKCDSPASEICAFCVGDDAFACDRHARRHECGESEGWLPVVNSPRVGICGYDASW